MNLIKAGGTKDVLDMLRNDIGFCSLQSIYVNLLNSSLKITNKQMVVQNM